MKITEQKNGWYTVFYKENCWYVVTLRRPDGEVYDKMRCDTYRDARVYLGAFNRIAKYWV